MVGDAGRSGERLGSCLTTILGIFRAIEVEGVLSVPPDRGWELKAAVSFGYPIGNWGVASRRPVEEVTYSNQWGQPVTWKANPPSFDGGFGRDYWDRDYGD